MILGLHGKKRSGKNTVADIISRIAHEGEDHTNLKAVVQLAFADTLKDLCSKMYNIPISAFYLEKLKDEVREDVLDLGLRSVRTPRDLLCFADGPLKEAFGPDVFVDALNSKIMRNANSLYLNDKVLFVITDVRYPNEAAYLRRVGRMLNITRSESDHLAGSDDSEAGVDTSGAMTITNDGSLDDLEAQVRTVMQAYGYSFK